MSVKWGIFLRFGLVSVAVLLAGAGLGLALASAVGAWMGWMAFAASGALVVVAAWGAFTPNAPLFGRVISGGGTSERVLVLTFDDGPDPDTTPKVLDALRERRVRATFFVLGRHAERYPDIVKRIHEDGHEVASHGYDHSLLTFAGEASVHGQLARTERVLADASGAAPAKLFRAPHGFRNPFVGRAARARGYHVVGWTKGVWDTARPGVEKIVNRSVDGFRAGAILLLHDADGSGAGDDRSQTAAAVPEIVDAGKRAGFEFVTVSELAALTAGRRRPLWKLLLALAVAAVLADIALQKFDYGILQRVDIGWWWIVAAVLANLVSIAFKAVVWHEALEAVPGGIRVRYRHIVPAMFIGFLLNTVLLARVGEIARIGVLRRRLRRDGEDMPVATIAGTLLSEQIVLGFSLLVVIGATMALLSVPKWAVRLVVALAVVVFVMALAGLGIVALSRYRGGRYGDPAFASAWWRALVFQGSNFLHGVASGQRLFRRPLRMTWAIVAGLLSWAAQIAGIHWALMAFGIHHGLGAAMLVFFTSTLVGLFPILPGNIGVFQAAVIAPLQLSYNVDYTTALQFGIGLQVIEAVLGVGLGFVFLSREGLSLAEARALE